MLRKLCRPGATHTNMLRRHCTTHGMVKPGSAAGVDFDALSFGYSATRCLVRYEWRDGEWDR
jgi:hypothetical protein